ESYEVTEQFVSIISINIKEKERKWSTVLTVDHFYRKITLKIRKEGDL
ncbi:hypothetical protein HMPREF2738_03108, partial [Clostridiales bacterium KLE1615]